MMDEMWQVEPNQGMGGHARPTVQNLSRLLTVFNLLIFFWHLQSVGQRIPVENNFVWGKIKQPVCPAEKLFYINVVSPLKYNS